MQAVIRRRAALAACGFALCGALAAPAVIEAASAIFDTGQSQTQVDAERKKPKKPPRH
ncbi:hypothetical protein [Streptomyces sp. Root1310]|uniref:hypothetical protein n=1 Tax=Streptomyces sp. Root1310 TaxID=1736452 RepID=UPI000A81F55A|nr:hypothetical protein [Streptomyces sp. Root1310]